MAHAPVCPPVLWGLAGWYGYDAVTPHREEAGATCPPDEIGCPDILLPCRGWRVVTTLGQGCT